MVFGSSKSFPFAQLVWRDAALAAEPALFDALPKNVGVITAAREACYSSKPIVSKEAHLVNRFARGQEDGPSDSDGYVPGFLMRNTMFGRQFNWILAYGMRDRPIRTMSDFLERMNPPQVEANGLLAECVSDAGFRERRFDFFFPFAPA
jgi:hypothetical protein